MSGGREGEIERGTEREREMETFLEESDSLYSPFTLVNSRKKVLEKMRKRALTKILSEEKVLTQNLEL